MLSLYNWGVAEILQLTFQLRPQPAQRSIVQSIATLQPSDQGKPIVIVALQGKLQLIIRAHRIRLDPLAQELQAVEQP